MQLIITGIVIFVVGFALGIAALIWIDRQSAGPKF